MNDFVIPMVFPDYLIAVIERPIDFSPQILKDQDFFPKHVRIPATKVPELGHAGVLFINGMTGATKYYEYGRYDRAALGLVMRRPVPDVKMQSNLPTLASLKATLRRISIVAGQKGRIEGAFIELPDGSYPKMVAYVEKRVKDNTNAQRPAYHLLTNSCLHFMKETAEAGGADMPWVIDPRPAGYIERVRASFPPLDYTPRPETLRIPVLDASIRSAVQKRAAAAGKHGR